jgi:hypothetical protein
MIIRGSVMFIGLLDAKRNPYHPTIVSRVDADLVEWSLDYWKRGWLRLKNRTPLKFTTHWDIERPGFYAFFRDIDDVESFYAPIPFAHGEDLFGRDSKHLADVGTITIVRAGDDFILDPGQIVINLPGPAKFF